MRARAIEAGALAVLVIAATPSWGQVPPASVVDRIAGLRLDGTSLLGPGDGASVEFSDVELFGVAGLRLTGARATMHVRGAPVGFEAARLGSPVGSQARATLRAGVESGRWRLALRGGVESLALAGTPGESSLVAGLVSGVDVGGATLAADVETIHSAAARYTFLTLAVAGPSAGRARLVASMHYHGPGVLSVGVAAQVTVHRALSLLGGWDDGTETARAGVRVCAGRFSLSTGAFHHPVLGISQGASVTVAW